MGYLTQMETRGLTQMETRGATLDRAVPDSAQGEELGDELVTSAELSECTCPDWCARDHDRD